MARITGGTYRTIEELGQSIISQVPSLKGRDPEDVGERALRNPKYSRYFRLAPEKYSDIDVSTAAGKFFPDFATTAGESIEGLGELIKHPVDTGLALGKTGLSAMQQIQESAPAGQQTNLMRALSLIPLSEETHEGTREFGRELKRSVSPEGIQNRPALALSNALMAVPGGAGVKTASTVGRTGKFLKTLKDVRNVVDAAELPFTAVRGVGGEAARRFGGASSRLAGEVADKASSAAQWGKGRGINVFRSAKDFAEALRSGNESLGVDLLSSLLGFTTGKGPRFIRQMIKKGAPQDILVRAEGAPGKKSQAISIESGPKIQREFRDMPAAEAEMTIVRRALAAVDRFKDGMGKAFAEALGQLPLKDPIEIDLSMRRQARAELRKMNVPVEDAERLEVTDVHIEAIPEHRDLLPSGVFPGGKKQTRRMVPTGEARLVFPDFGDKPGTTTSIASQGGGRGLVEEAYLRLLNAPEAVTVEDLVMFRRQIDDALQVTTSDIQGEARVALRGLRDVVAGKLDEVPGYRQTMRQYDEASGILWNWEAELGLTPGNLTATGEVRNVRPSEIYNNLKMAFSEGSSELPFAALEDLQRRSGEPSLIPGVIGSEARDITGRGLVVKSELSQAGRAVGGILAMKSHGALWSIPAATLFSPRGVNEFMLQALDPATDIRKGAQSVASQGKGRWQQAREAFGATGENLTRKKEALQEFWQSAKRANEASQGSLAREAIKENWTIGQLFERLQINLGVEFEEGDLAQSPRASTFMKTIGGIDTTPAAR